MPLPYVRCSATDRLGYRQIPSDLNGNNIHRLEMVFTLKGHIQYLQLQAPGAAI